MERHYKVAFLAEPHPYKVLYGGRDGIKSWSIARQLVVDAAQRPLKTLCCRETMQSIDESVHQLLSDQIANLGLEGHFEIQKKEINGINGSKFAYAGLRHNAGLIKSYEGFDRAWVEEAHACTRDSLLKYLIPTIRKEGAEIWMSLNPDLSTDFVYQYFVCNPPPGSVVVETSYLDNIWLSTKSKNDIEYMKSTNFDEYEHIYLGVPREAVEGAIYKDEIRKAEKDGHICKVEYDARFPVDTFWDLGYGDAVAIWFAQWVGLQWHVIDYYTCSQKPIDWYLRRMQEREYTYGTCVLPWDGGAKQLGTGMSIEQLIRAKGYKVRVIPQLKVHQRINALRTIFPQLYFDKDKCADGLAGLRRYQWGPPQSNGQARREPVHDAASHPADALGNLPLFVTIPKQEKERPKPRPGAPVVYRPFG
jgi:phage terminase large subunit